MSTMPLEIRNPNPEGAEEARNPKPETRKKAEIRSPKAEVLPSVGAVFAANPNSDFGFRPSFGPRTSDFGFHLTAP